MSARGLIHVVDGANADFSSLDQWERELQLYTALKKLKVFALFRVWKAFALWRRALRQRKVQDAKHTLQKNLFLLSPVFQVRRSRWLSTLPGQPSHTCWPDLGVLR